MKEFILENWQLITSLVLAVVNLVITLVVHGKSKLKIDNLSGVSLKVSDALLAIAAINKEIQNEIKNTSQQGQAHISQDCAKD